MTNEELSNEDLLKVFQVACQELESFGGSHTRNWFYEVREEVLSRMKREGE